MHNISFHATKEFCKQLHDNFNIEDLLVDIYFHFDRSSKGKNILVDFCAFCDNEYSKILQFSPVRWLGLSEYLARTLKLFPSLRSCFLSQDIKNGERILTPLDRLIDSFSNPMLQIYCTFLRSPLQRLQRSDPVVHIIYSLLFNTTCILLSRFIKAEFPIQCK